MANRPKVPELQLLNFLPEFIENDASNGISISDIRPLFSKRGIEVDETNIRAALKKLEDKGYIGKNELKNRVVGRYRYKNYLHYLLPSGISYRNKLRAERSGEEATSGKSKSTFTITDYLTKHKTST